MRVEQPLRPLFMLYSSPATYLSAVLILCAARTLIDGHEASRDLKYALVLLPFVGWDYLPWTQVTLLSIPWPTLGIVAFAFAVLLFVYYLLAWYFFSTLPAQRPPHGPSPYLLPARTSHTRLFPRKHSFSYSYLLIAVPVGWQGRIGSFLSVSTAATSKASTPPQARTWFTVDASDYLDRGTGHRGLKAKLDDFLHSHGVDPGRFTSAWLVTAPRFLGYSFNPISFWYLYNGNALDAMVLEVNNTFDERRMYFLTRGDGCDSVDADDASVEDHKFHGAWAKDFHVSPFNSRKGGYALIASDPSFKDGPWIDNTITLKSSKERAKLVARIFSTDPAVDVRNMSVNEMARFVASWFWVGFVTSPRIIREAARLFFQRKLHVWYRPEVSNKSIGRTETERECVIEAVFRDFLRHQATPKNIALRYIAAGNVQPHEEFLSLKEASSARHQRIDDSDTLTLHVLTPLFYTHIALAPSIAEYMKQNAAGPVEQQTFECSSLDKFTTLISIPETATASTLLSFRLLAHCRNMSTEQEKASHELDRFVLHDTTRLRRRNRDRYRKAATALVLADTFCYGQLAALDAAIVICRLALLFWGDRCVSNALRCAVVGCKVPFGVWTGCVYLILTMQYSLW